MTTRTLSDDYRPATFLERGVAVPFTTPFLTAARVRPSSHRGRLEFVIANPSGAPGFYVMGWSGLNSLGSITVHDRLLHEAISKAELVTPSNIREAARAVAMRGAAGRPAAQSAQAAARKDADDALIATFLLTIRLLRQAGLTDVDWRRFSLNDDDLRSETRAMIAKLEPVLAADVETIFGWVETLGEIIAPVGFPSKEYRSRLELGLEALVRLRQSITAFANADVSDAAHCAAFVAEVAALTIDAAAPVLAECHARQTDVLRLLRMWSAEREHTRELFARPDWLLDGWQTICALWEDARSADTERQRATVLEIERMVPVMPREIAVWAGAETKVGSVWAQRRWVKAQEDWRQTVNVHDLKARNELIRACAA